MTTLELREGYEVRASRWGVIMVGSRRTGRVVAYDPDGGQARLYDHHNCVEVIRVTPDTWQAAAHAYFTKRKLESPWEAV